MDTKNLHYFIFSIIVVGVLGYVSTQINKKMDTTENDEYKIIKNYLLNDSPLYGHNRPKIWIHTKYEINARKWRDFYSRNSTDLNQPYIHFTIKSIIDHCGDDFNVCLIDDQTFSKLIPSWDIDIAILPEPIKSHYRELGLAELVYFYGGMVVPNTFLCLKNLKELYDECAQKEQPFVCENINRTTNLVKQREKMAFMPDVFFMGAVKNDPVLLELVDYLKKRNQTSHFTNELELVGDTSYWCLLMADKGKLQVINGELIGVKNRKKKPILLEDLLEENFLDLSPYSYGIYIPEAEVLKRTKYQWFAVLPVEQILDSNLIIAKYFQSSIVDTTSEYMKKNVKSSYKSVVAI
jgi:hypothetical protein